MAKPTDEMFDKRIVDRNLMKGLISKADQEKYVAKLPDMDKNAEWVDAGAEEKAEPEEG